MILHPQTAAAPEVVVPPLMHPEQPIDTPRQQRGDPEKRGEIPVPHHDLTGDEAVPQRAEQRGLARLLPLVWAQGQLTHRPGGQRDHGDQSGQGESHAGLLGAGLGEGPWLAAVSGMDTVVPSTNWTRRPFQVQASLACSSSRSAGAPDQIGHDLQGEALAGLAVTAGLRATGLLAPCDAEGDQPGHRLAAGMVGAEDLGEKGPEGDQGREDPVAEADLIILQDAPQRKRGRAGRGRGVGARCEVHRPCGKSSGAYSGAWVASLFTRPRRMSSPKYYDREAPFVHPEQSERLTLKEVPFVSGTESHSDFA